MTPPKLKPDNRKTPRKLAPRPDYTTTVFQLQLPVPQTQQPAQLPGVTSTVQHYYHPPQHYYHPQHNCHSQHSYDLQTYHTSQNYRINVRGPPQLYFSPYYSPLPGTYVWHAQFEHEVRPYLNVDNAVVDERTRQWLLSVAWAGGAAIQSAVPREESEVGAQAHQGDGAGGVKTEGGTRVSQAATTLSICATHGKQQGWTER